MTRLLVILLLAAASCRAGAEPCRYDFERADFVGDCSAPASASRAPLSAECKEAKENADWVLFKDRSARGTYLQGRQRGLTPFDALLAAQGHNRNAQDSFRRCGAWLSQYVAGHDQGAGPQADLPRCSASAMGQCSGCERVCRPGERAICRPGVSEYGPIVRCSVPARCLCE